MAGDEHFSMSHLHCERFRHSATSTVLYMKNSGGKMELLKVAEID
jgi:hypothetical protein